jgi:hypothetical protein
MSMANQIIWCDRPVKAGMVAVLAPKPVIHGENTLNFVATVCERMAFVFGGCLISVKPVKPGQTQSNLIQPNPTKKSGLIRLNPAKKSDQVRPSPTLEMAWVAPVGFKTGMETCNA